MDQQQQRAEWRDRKQRSRANHAAAAEKEQWEELKRRDPEAARIRELWAEVMTKPITRPGTPLPDPDPADIKARSEEFDRVKSECERKATEESRRTLWGLTHGVPIGWASRFPEEFPTVLENVKGEI